MTEPASLRSTDRSPEYKEPFAFIVGCARSGTTLLHRIIDAHPLVVITPEMHWISHHLKPESLRTEPVVTSETLSGLADHKRFSHFDLKRQDFEALLNPGESIPYKEFLGRLFGLYARTRGKPIVGNKTPAYVRRIRKLHGLFPRARFVHIIRDGRDVCLSVMNWKKADRTAGRYATWREDPVSTAALWWERKVRVGHEAGVALGSKLYYEIRYEDLISNTEIECRALCEFLNIPYDPTMVRFSEGKTRSDLPNARKTPKKAWLPVTSGLRDWRTEMPERDVERFEAASGELLDAVGYERVFPEPSTEALEHAAKIREAFTREAFSKEQILPEGWNG